MDGFKHILNDKEKETQVYQQKKLLEKSVHKKFRRHKKKAFFKQYTAESYGHLVCFIRTMSSRVKKCVKTKRSWTLIYYKMLRKYSFLSLLVSFDEALSVFLIDYIILCQVLRLYGLFWLCLVKCFCFLFIKIATLCSDVFYLIFGNLTPLDLLLSQIYKRFLTRLIMNESVCNFCWFLVFSDSGR